MRHPLELLGVPYRWKLYYPHRWLLSRLGHWEWEHEWKTCPTGERHCPHLHYKLRKGEACNPLWPLYDIADGELPPGGTVKCGNRSDLPKKERVHSYQLLGEDVRNGAERGFVEGNVYACRRCGADKFKRHDSTEESRP